MPQTSPEEAKAAYEAMDDDAKIAVTGLVESGKSPREAVRLVRSQHAQDVVREGSNASDALGGPTAGEKAASASLGAANALSDDIVPRAKAAFDSSGLAGKAALAVGAPLAGGVFGPVAGLNAITKILGHTNGQDYKDALANTSTAEAEQQAPAAYTLGHGGGEILNSALQILGGSTGGILRGAANDAKSAGVRLKGAGRELAAESIDGHAPTKVGALSRAMRAIFGEGGEVKPAQILEEASAHPEPVPMPPKAPPAPKPLEVAPENVLEEALVDEGAPLELARDVPKGSFKPAAVGGHPIKFTKPIEDAPPDFAKEAEGFDPGGQDWQRWLKQEAATSEPRPDLESAAKVYRTPTEGARPSLKGKTPPAPSTPNDMRAAALKKPLEDMPADVMAAETPKPVPYKQIPKITGTGEQLAAHVKSLPEAQRRPFLVRVAKDMGKDVATKIGEAAGLGRMLHANPL